jgi:hypothetical protein
MCAVSTSPLFVRADVITVTCGLKVHVEKPVHILAVIKDNGSGTLRDVTQIV